MAQRRRPNSADTPKAVIVGGDRIPFARSNQDYRDASNQELLTTVLKNLSSRYSLDGERLGEVVGGAVLKHSRDFNLTRESVLGSGLNPATPAYDMGQACATSVQAVIAISNKIALGQVESGIACGSDTTSDAPIAVGDGLRKLMLRFNAGRTTMERVGTLSGLRPSHLIPDIPRNAEPRTGKSMGDHAAITAEAWSISRADQDSLSLDSHHHLAAAYDRGFFDDLVTPHLTLKRDQNLRPTLSLEKLSGLSTVFGSGPKATMTAGNSTPLTDGAAAVLLGSAEWADERGLPKLAKVIDAETAAVDYVSGEEGLLMAPVYALPRLLARNGMGLGDFELYEIHEAFASTVLATMAAWESDVFCKEKLGLDSPLGSIDRSKLNVAGSSLATGHPFAATGARVVATLAKLLSEKGSGARGLISVCAAGGQGVVMILEAL